MDATDRSLGTAHWIAAARARESAREDRLFEDPFAGALAGEIGARALEASERVSGSENPFLPIRTRWFDDVITSQANGMSQVIVLGAGFDTRPMRLPLRAAVGLTTDQVIYRGCAEGWLVVPSLEPGKPTGGLVQAQAAGAR